jgi:hypothetical protein
MAADVAAPILAAARAGRVADALAAMKMVVADAWGMPSDASDAVVRCVAH